MIEILAGINQQDTPRLLSLRTPEITITHRLAPATKLAQVLYNQRLIQRRSRSQKPEYKYNLDLMCRFLADQQLSVVEPQGPYLRFDTEILQQVREQLATKLKLDASRPWLMVHAGSGGLANNLSIPQYVRLIIKLNQACPELQCVLTAELLAHDLPHRHLVLRWRFLKALSQLCVERLTLE